jgi:hypothetical protein
MLFAAFPDFSAQWHLERRLAAYSCGGSRGVSPHSLFTPFPGHRPLHAYRGEGHLSSLSIENGVTLKSGLSLFMVRPSHAESRLG